MNSHLPLTFAIDKACALDTLEAILAIARRGGLRLSRLHLQEGETDDLVSLELVAIEPAMLDLFAARLNNLIGVSAIDMALPAMPRMHVA